MFFLGRWQDVATGLGPFVLVGLVTFLWWWRARRRRRQLAAKMKQTGEGFY
jgi:hypothetical protein